MREPTKSTACALSPRDQNAALAWIGDLNAAALRTHRRDDLVVTLTYAPQARVRVLQMIREEQECCDFLDFRINDAPEAITVTIAAPESARAQIEPIFDALSNAPAACDVACRCATKSRATSTPSVKRGSRRRRPFALPAALAVACAACCAVPLAPLLAAGALTLGGATIGGLACGPLEAVAVGIIGLGLVGGWVATRRKRRA